MKTKPEVKGFSPTPTTLLQTPSLPIQIGQIVLMFWSKRFQLHRTKASSTHWLQLGSLLSKT